MQIHVPQRSITSTQPFTPISTNISPHELDDILDEIDQIERKQQNSIIAKKPIKWRRITKQIRKENFDFILDLITNKEIEINARDPANKKTILIYTVILGNINMVQQLLELGADANISDDNNKNALCYAKEIGDYKLIELLYYHQLSPDLRTNLREITDKIHEKNKSAEIMRSFQFESGGKYMKLHSVITKYIIRAIKNRHEFSDDMLYYAWYFEVNPDISLRNVNGYTADIEIDASSIYLKQCNPFKYSKLWKIMMQTFVDIISDTSDKTGWKWLKKYFIPSLIWYLPHPNANITANDTESTLKNTLFYELWKRISAQLKKQSNILKNKVNEMKTNDDNAWNELIAYNVNTSKYPQGIRQDTCACLLPSYTAKDVIMNANDDHFDAKAYYDRTIYLNALIFRANIINNKFQDDMRTITKEICTKYNDIDAKYKQGDVATLDALQRVVNEDKAQAKYPRSASILNVNTFGLEFESVHDMMQYLAVFTYKVKRQSAGCVVDIIQCTNAYTNTPGEYMDLTLNVLVKAKDNAIVAEIKFYLKLMSDFKRKADTLRYIEDVAESVCYHRIFEQEMNKFVFWGFSEGNTSAMWNKHCSGWLTDEHILIQLHCFDDVYLKSVLREMIHINDMKMNKLQMIFIKNCIESLKYILYESVSNVKEIMRLLFATKAMNAFKVNTDNQYLLDTTREMLRYSRNDRKYLINMLCFLCNKNESKTVFMSICESNDKDIVHILKQFVFENDVLSKDDVCRLLLMEDKQQKTALFYAFKSKNADLYNLIIDAFAQYQDKLIRLLSAKDAAQYIVPQSVRLIVDIIDNDDFTSQLLTKITPNPQFELLLSQWRKYKENQHTFDVLCYFGKYEAIKKHYITDMKGNKLNKLLFGRQNISKMNADEVSSGESETKACEDTEDIAANEAFLNVLRCNDDKLLNLLLLHNDSLSNDEKFSLLAESYAVEHTSNACRLSLFQYFKNDGDKLLELLSNNINHMQYLLAQSDVKSFEFLLNGDSALSDEDKLDFLLYENVLHDAFQCGAFAAMIIKYFMNDAIALKTLLLFAHNDDKQLSITQLFGATNNDYDDTCFILKWLLSKECALLDLDKKKILFHTDRNGFVLLHYLIQNTKYSKYVLDAVKYLMSVYDGDLVIELLAKQTQSNGDTVLMKGIQSQSHTMNISHGYRYIRYNKANKITFECLQLLFETVDDTESVLDLLNITNNKDLTLYQIATQSKQYEIQRLIEQYCN